MSNTEQQVYSPLRYLWFIALIGLPLLAWHGILDDYSSANLNSSISSAGLIYGTARGINALVSLLQGTEVGVVFVTFSIGEILDPINDLIERFSQVLLVALGSLALQKILLTVVSHTIFNVLLSIAAACTGITLLMNRPNLLRTCLKLFLIVAFLRFSLGLVVLANTWVDHTFLDKADKSRHLAMEEFRGELREIDTRRQGQQEAASAVAEIQFAINKNENIYTKGQSTLSSADSRISTSKENVNSLIEKADSFCMNVDPLSLCPEQVQEAKAKLKELEQKRSTLFKALENLREAIDDASEEITCIETRARGQNCKFWDRIPDAPDAGELRAKLEGVNADISDFAENTIDLLVSLLLKTVVIPLLFIYLLLRVLRVNWERI